MYWMYDYKHTVCAFFLALLHYGDPPCSVMTPYVWRRLPLLWHVFIMESIHPWLTNEYALICSQIILIIHVVPSSWYRLKTIQVVDNSSLMFPTSSLFMFESPASIDDCNCVDFSFILPLIFRWFLEGSVAWICNYYCVYISSVCSTGCSWNAAFIILSSTQDDTRRHRVHIYIFTNGCAISFPCPTASPECESQMLRNEGLYRRESYRLHDRLTC